MQFRWLENKWNVSSEKLKLLLTWQDRVPKIETLAAHALMDSFGQLGYRDSMIGPYVKRMSTLVDLQGMLKMFCSSN